MSHDTVDSLFRVALGFFTGDSPESLASYKADSDAAFRRVPLRPEHRRWAWVLFRHGDAVLAAQHYALPFGAGMPSAVHTRATLWDWRSARRC